MLGNNVLVLRAAQSLSLRIRDAQPVHIYKFISRDSVGETLYISFHIENHSYLAPILHKLFLSDSWREGRDPF